jgi:hypothetical protein
MSRSQHSATFIVPEPANVTNPSDLATKSKGDAKPFVIVPASMVVDSDKVVEPHWHPAIDKATD